MEIRARYVLMGAFTLGVIAAVFGFLYWMHSTGGFRERAVYRIQVENSVSGLLKGAAVLFNGIKVGEVTELRLNPNLPSQVMVSISVDRETPIRTDTRIDIDFQGLTGIAYIAMNGGTVGAPVPAAKDGPPILAANTNGQTMGQAARDALHRLNTILDENAAGFHNTINNFSTFSDVLAKNSDRVNSILAGLERMTGGSKGAPGALNDLTAARNFDGTPKALNAILSVADPTALISLDTQNVIIRDGKGDAPPRWADNLPKLMQARVVQSFENAGFLGSVVRPSDNATADYQLLIDVRNFQVNATPSPVADVEFAAKIMDNSGKPIEAKIFHVSQSAPSMEDAAVIGALDAAFGKTASQLVVWASNVVSARQGDASKQDTPAPDGAPQNPR